MSEIKLKASVCESRVQTTCSCPWLTWKWSAGTGTQQDSQERRPPLESHVATISAASGRTRRTSRESAWSPWPWSGIE